MKYLIIIEATKNGYSAYAPDLPGCVATGKTKTKVEQAIQEAILFHLEGLREEGVNLPKPHTDAEYLEFPVDLSSSKFRPLHESAR